MHPYLTRLGIFTEVQDFFSPYYFIDGSGNLCFHYGTDAEIYGLAYHRVPITDGNWITGISDYALVRQVIICSSAMEAIAWLNCNFKGYCALDNLLFVATGNRITDKKLGFLRQQLPERKYSLLFGNDLLGKVCDLKAAAGLHNFPIHIRDEGDSLFIEFRHKRFDIQHQAFSLSAFSSLSGFRFGVQTLKSKQNISWLDQLTTQSFNV